MRNRRFLALVLGALTAVTLAGCMQPQTETQSTIDPKDPMGRLFTGTIVGFRPPISTMLISKDEHVGNDAFPNVIRVKYDAQTKFFLDNEPMTLDQIQPYMTVTIQGHMRDEQLFAETAKFSSVLPKNVRPAPTAPATAPAPATTSP